MTTLRKVAYLLYTKYSLRSLLQGKSFVLSHEEELLSYSNYTDILEFFLSRQFNPSLCKKSGQTRSLLKVKCRRQEYFLDHCANVVTLMLFLFIYLIFFFFDKLTWYFNAWSRSLQFQRTFLERQGTLQVCSFSLGSS